MIDYRRFFENLPSPYMMLDRDLRFVDMNARYLATIERSREELIGCYVFDAFPETGERLAKFRAAFLKALSGTPNTLVREPFSIARPEPQGGGKREVFWSCHHLPIYDADGEICGVAQKAEDVTSEVLAEKMRDVIARE
ncbi:MAG: PAS domain-containing protein, partial [Proteobacteria bacterium]|nr:PAS domain-containing protein [Pseudomonadota bacterium]